jgi:hypothetical protein
MASAILVHFRLPSTLYRPFLSVHWHGVPACPICAGYGDPKRPSGKLARIPPLQVRLSLSWRTSLTEGEPLQRCSAILACDGR